MNKKDLIKFLILEILVAVNAFFSFSYISSHNRLAAIYIASVGFILLGAVIVWKSRRWLDKYYSPTYWLGNIHLWGTSLPLFINRAFYGNNFSNTNILGIPISQIHEMSSKIFYGLVIVTALDLARVFYRDFRRRN